MVVQFQRGSDSSEMLLLPLGVVDDIESAAAAVPLLLDAPAALSAGGDDRDGPSRPRSAAPLVRVREHEVAGKDGEKQRKKEAIDRGRATFSRGKLCLQSETFQACCLLVFNSIRAVTPRKGDAEPQEARRAGEKYQNGAERGRIARTL